VSRFLRVEELKSFQRMGGRPAAARLGCDLARDFFARARLLRVTFLRARDFCA
jgi:hypothetical protein